MRMVILALVMCLAVPALAQAQYETYEEYQAAQEKEAAREIAIQQRREMLDLQRQQVEAQKQAADELREMRQYQYWRDVEDRQEREKQRQFDRLP